MHVRFVSIGLAATLLALLAPGPASANGRFPRAQRFIESTDHPTSLALYGTYGLIVTRDGGKNWSHVCEASTGLYMGEDPLLEFMPSGQLLARTEVALVASDDDLCGFSPVLGDALGSSGEEVDDITRDPTQPSAVLALVGVYDATSGFSARFTESSNGGVTWSARTNLPKESVSHGISLDVAPSMPNRVYVTGLDSNGTGQLLVSDDRGSSWRALRLGETDSNSAPYLVTVSRSNPDVLLVRTNTFADVDGIDTASDALLLSKDGGKTWQTLLVHTAKLLGVALSPDEKTLLAGYGDPQVAANYVDPDEVGLYRARVEDLLTAKTSSAPVFEKIFDASVTCLRWTTNALYACSTQSDRGFEVGKANDAEFSLTTAAPFAPFLRLSDVRPEACTPGTKGYACYSDPVNGFPSVCQLFGAPCDIAPPPPGGAPETPDGGTPTASGGAVGASGGGASSGGAATGAAGVAASAGASSGAAPSAPASGKDDGSSCAHRALSPASRPSIPLALVVGASALWYRRRQNRHFRGANRSKTS